MGSRLCFKRRRKSSLLACFILALVLYIITAPWAYNVDVLFVKHYTFFFFPAIVNGSENIQQPIHQRHSHQRLQRTITRNPQTSSLLHHVVSMEIQNKDPQNPERSLPRNHKILLATRILESVDTGTIRKSKNSQNLPINHELSTTKIPASSRPATGSSPLATKESIPPKEDPCPVNEITPKHPLPYSNLSCVPHKPSKSGCVFAASEFKYNLTRNTCSLSKRDSNKFLPTNICNVTDQNRFSCNFNECGNYYTDEVWIHALNVHSGDIEVVAKEDQSVTELRRKVTKAALESISKGFNFIFLSCGNMKNKTQFVPLTPNYKNKVVNSVHHRQLTDRVNVNLVIFDSMSRAHFYRSLKKTIETFNKINSNKKDGAGEVLDFELFQAIHGHSQENGYALMNGEVFSKNVSEEKREEEPTRFPLFYQKLKDEGYRILYQDDMCYQSGYGIIRDFGMLSSYWRDLYGNLKNRSNIDDFGLTFASCKLIMDVFNGDTATFNMYAHQRVCYNGRPNDAYFLEYNIKQFLKLEKHHHEKLFAFNNLQFPHDAFGLNAQTMDIDVANFVESASHLQDTLTIIMADHGSSFGDYSASEMEGRYENYHPALFMIVPEPLKKTLGSAKVNALRLNQKRILTMIDIHNGIRHIANAKHPSKGFLEVAPSDKHCNNIPLGKPNLCICEGAEFFVVNSTELVGHVEFASGYLNNLITEHSAHGDCKRIVPTSFQNIMQKFDADGAITSFDVLVESGKGSSNKMDRFSFEVYHKESTSAQTYEMKLLNKGRLSKYGLYNKQCTDAPDTFRYCICDNKHDSKTGLQSSVVSKSAQSSDGFSRLLARRTSNRYEIFKNKLNITEKLHVLIANKVALLVREFVYPANPIETIEDEKGPHLGAVTFEAVSMDESSSFQVDVEFNSLNNIQKLNAHPCGGIVKPNTIHYLCTIVRKTDWKAFYNYTVTQKRVPYKKQVVN